MYQIDKLSYDSPLAGIHPGEKAVFFILSLFMVLLSGSCLIPGAVFLTMGLILLWKSRVSPSVLAKLIAVPLIFILSAVIPVLVSMNTRSFEGSSVLIQNRLHWGISPENIGKSLMLLSRSLAGVMCFLFFILTTPIGQIDTLLKKLRVSPVFREMLILIYRFIFLLSDISSDIYKSQKSRQGYTRFSLSINSLGLLCRALFNKCGHYSDQAALALQARSCDGLIQFVQPATVPRHSVRVLIALHFCLLIILFLIEKQWLI